MSERRPLYGPRTNRQPRPQQASGVRVAHSLRRGEQGAAWRMLLDAPQPLGRQLQEAMKQLARDIVEQRYPARICSLEGAQQETNWLVAQVYRELEQLLASGQHSLDDLDPLLPLRSPQAASRAHTLLADLHENDRVDDRLVAALADQLILHPSLRTDAFYFLSSALSCSAASSFFNEAYHVLSALALAGAPLAWAPSSIGVMHRYAQGSSRALCGTRLSRRARARGGNSNSHACHRCQWFVYNLDGDLQQGRSLDINVHDLIIDSLVEDPTSTPYTISLLENLWQQGEARSFAACQAHHQRLLYRALEQKAAEAIERLGSRWTARLGHDGPAPDRQDISRLFALARSGANIARISEELRSL